MKNQLVLTVKRDFANISARFHKTAGSAHNRRWLTDNFYLMEKQAKMICQNCKKQELRRFSVDEKGEFALLSLLSRYLDQVQNQVTEETLLTFTEENAKALTRSELWALPMALSAQILHRIAALPENLEGLAPLVKSLYAASDIDWADAYLAVSPLEKILSRDATYRQMDFDSKQLYQLEIAEMAQKSGRSEAEIAQEAILEAEKARVGVEYFILGPGSARFGAKKKKGSLFWYLAAVFAISHALSFLCFLATGSFWGYLLSHVLTWEVAITLINTVLQRVAKPKILPRLALLEGIGDAAKTLVVVPALLSSEKRAKELCGQLETLYLANREKNLYFALLGDFKEAGTASLPEDEMICNAAKNAVAALNEKYGGVFFYFSRRRVLCGKKYMGYERKRGALLELCRYLRGREGTTISTAFGNTAALSGTKYVITLDADTFMPIGTAKSLIGILQHPQNRPVVSGGKVVSGYAMVQPRVNIDLQGANQTMFTKIFAGLGGIDQYSTACYDLYQDTFGEGIFTGKGIFDVDVYLEVLDDAIPDNLVLSHDLLEGSYLRCAMATDLEFIDGYPAGYRSFVMRQTRWIRGDWQIIPWLFPKVKNASGAWVKNPLNHLSRWKIADNLRRSITPVFSLLAIFMAFGVLKGGLFWLWLTLGVEIFPFLLYLLNVTFSQRAGTQKYFSNIVYGLKSWLFQTTLGVVFLANNAIKAAQAILTALWRLCITRQNMLEWVTASDSEGGKNSLWVYYKKMAASPVCGVFLVVLSAWLLPGRILAACFFALLWILAPLLAYFISLPQKLEEPLSAREQTVLRHIAFRTFRYFDEFLTEEDHFLIPDNVQLAPQKGPAHRTSPTNIGLSMIALVCARDFGFICQGDMLSRLSGVLDTVERLEKWHGHLYNWYDTKTLRPLRPVYVSTVDSGNFLACLMTVRQSLTGEGDLFRGLKDILDVTGSKVQITQESWPKALDEAAAGPLNETARRFVENYQKAYHADLSAIAARLDALIAGMDFLPLYSKKRSLFAIGYLAEEDKLTDSYYDLLASECRQISFIAVAKGWVPMKHWFRLGRTLAACDGYKGLASWTGTMFEYFMPALFMKTYPNSLFDETYHFVLHVQQKFARRRKVPWGVSESGYFAFDRDLNYQYKAFGIDELSFKRQDEKDVVISPYSTALALAVSPKAAFKNLLALRKEGMMGEFGFYEAADYTPGRILEGEKKSIVKSHMAHHQGMALAAILNALENNVLKERFSAIPEMAAAQYLLCERIPVNTVTKGLDRRRPPQQKLSGPRRADLVRECEAGGGAVQMALLSNGPYQMAITNAMTGYTKLEDTFLTRYRKDLSGIYGCQVYLRNTHFNTQKRVGEDGTCVFYPHKAEFYTDISKLSAKTKVSVFPSENMSLLEVSVKNEGVAEKTAEVTSFLEVTMAGYEDDLAHPAFSNLFVFTGFDREQNAVYALRRGRDAKNGKMAFLALLDGVCEFECDRAQFVGRNRSLRNPAAILGAFSQKDGAVLDPCLALRTRLTLSQNQRKSAVFVYGFCDDAAHMKKMLDKARGALGTQEEQAYARAKIENKYLNLNKKTEQEALSLLPYLVYPSLRFCDRRSQMRAFRGTVSDLWKHGVSGDLPILFLQVTDAAQATRLHGLLLCYKFYLSKKILIDVVISCTEPGYEKPVWDMVMREIAALDLLDRQNQKGGVYTLLNLSPGEAALFEAVSAASFNLSQECKISPPQWPAAKKQTFTQTGEVRPAPPLAFYNQKGGFTEDFGEYVVCLTNEVTPLPWTNVVANPEFGFLATEAGFGFTWFGNSHEWKLTPWSNDAVTNPPSEFFSFESGGVTWYPTQNPAPDGGTYVARFGYGYVTYEHTAESVEASVTQFAAAGGPLKLTRVRLKNLSREEKTVKITYHVAPVLGSDADHTAGRLYSFTKDGFSCVKNMLHQERCLFYTPESTLVLLPGQTGEAVFFFGFCPEAEIATLAGRHQDAQAAFSEAAGYWADLLGRIKVETPQKELDALMNGRLLYQAVGCRMFARSAFYQSGGAYGFRDQLQDALALAETAPRLLREQILRSAARQFTEGDVLHWWHETFDEPDKGVRTRFTDDRLWLCYAALRYVKATGDENILQEKIDFITDAPLAPGEMERYTQPKPAGAPDTLYEHMKRAVAVSMQFGPHGLCLMGGGDWNDGMNQVGAQGSGESVWLSWFFKHILDRFAPLCEKMGEANLGAEYKNTAQKLLLAIEENAWDGLWYMRAFYDDGTPIGSARSAECSIDLLPQSWAVIAGGGDKERARQAMASAYEWLADREKGIVKLLTPPFDAGSHNPGYIKGYLRGVRENGGQYTHAAVWAALAFARLGDADRALELFSMLNPLNHTQTPLEVQVYKAEPYAVAADVYAEGPNAGRGGWSWYTGAASWYYQAVLYGLLGFEKTGDRVTITPNLPAGWDGYTISYRYLDTQYVFHIKGEAPLEVLLVNDKKQHEISNG